MSEKINEGDRVTPLSGSPVMLVKVIQNEEALCTWLEGTKVCEDRFPVGLLRKHHPPGAFIPSLG